MRLLHGREHFGAEGAARHLEQPVDEGEPEHPSADVGFGAAEKLDEGAYRPRVKLAGWNQVEHPGVEDRLLVEVVALVALALAAPLVDIGEQPVGLRAPLGRQAHAQGIGGRARTAQPHRRVVQPSGIAGLPIEVDARDAERRGHGFRRVRVDPLDVELGARPPQRGVERGRGDRHHRVVVAAGCLHLSQEIAAQRVHHARSGHAQGGVGDLQIGHLGNDVERGRGGARRVVRAAEQNQPQQPLEVGRGEQAAREALNRVGDRRHFGWQVRAPQVELEEVQRVGKVAGIRQARNPSERRVVLVDRRHQRIGADARREVEIDPLEHVARMARLDERHELHRPDLQRDPGQRRGIGEHLRALTAVGRHLARRRAAVLLRRGVGAHVRRIEQLTPPFLVDLGQLGDPQQDVGFEFRRDARRVRGELLDRLVATRRVRRCARSLPPEHGSEDDRRAQHAGGSSHLRRPSEQLDDRRRAIAVDVAGPAMRDSDAVWYRTIPLQT